MSVRQVLPSDLEVGYRLDQALQVILGERYLPIRQNGVELYPQDEGAILVLQCIAKTHKQLVIETGDQITPVDPGGDTDAVYVQRTVKITRAQYAYYRSALATPPTVKLDRLAESVTKSITQLQEVLAVAQPKQETIRVKVVAGQLMPVPKGERGWLFECSVHEGSIINYGNRRYLWTGGQLVEQTEEVRGE